MGIYQVDKCIFTGSTVRNLEDGDMRNAIEYFVSISDREIFIRLHPDAEKWDKENVFFKKNKYLFEGLLLNNDWFENTKQLITISRLQELLQQKKYPVTPKDKSDALFQHLLTMQDEDGEKVPVTKYFRANESDSNSIIPYKKLFFKSERELIYYIEHLTQRKLITSNVSTYSGGGKEFHSFSVTVDGLNYGIQLQSEGDKSNLCFIAMSFNPDTQYIRNAIKEALWETGFKEILIDEIDLPSDSSINDQIIANLRKCRFCIADFTHQSKGVYFESGFALGQGKKVIYTCLKEHFDDAHFDIKPLQHIIYDTAEQLKKDLKHKIEAWVV